MTAATESFRNGEFVRQGGDQKEPATVFGIDVSRQAAGVREAGPAIEHVQRWAWTRIIDGYFDSPDVGVT